MTRKFSALTDDQLNRVAKLVHYALDAMNAYTGNSPAVGWNELPKFRKDVCRGVVSLVAKRLDGMVEERVSDKEAAGAMPDLILQVHDVWADAYRDNGWTYGEEYDPDNKTHPCLVPFEDLPESEAIKDVLVVGLVTVFFGTLDALDKDAEDDV